MNTGLYRNVPRHDYDKIHAENYSALKLVGRSPAHYREYKANGREDTDALRLGRACDLRVFEPQRFIQEVAVWTLGDKVKNKSAWLKFQDEHAGREIITAAEAEMCAAVAAAVCRVASGYLAQGEREPTLVWTEALTGLQCKGRPDWISTASRPCILDLKTTKNASPRAFERQAYDLNYHVQGAMYVDGAYAALGMHLPYLIAAVEKEPPYATQIYRLPLDVLAVGRETYTRWLETVRKCRAEDNWPAYSETELDLCLPAYASTNNSRSIVEVG